MTRQTRKRGVKNEAEEDEEEEQMCLRDLLRALYKSYYNYDSVVF